jgi:hypothetical protein
MIGVVICLAISAGLIILLVRYGDRFIKSEGYRFKESNDDVGELVHSDGSPTPSTPVYSVKPEVNVAMTDEQRVEELRLLQQAWDNDHSK